MGFFYLFSDFFGLAKCDSPTFCFLLSDNLLKVLLSYAEGLSVSEISFGEGHSEVGHLFTVYSSSALLDSASCLAAKASVSANTHSCDVTITPDEIYLFFI